MKIAGLTWWRGNYGSILQAYALQQLLELEDNVQYEILDQYGKAVSVGNLLSKIKSFGIKNTLHRIRWKFASKGFQDRNAALNSFIQEYLHVSKSQYSAENISQAVNEYDAFVCGSDQIWNPILSSLDDIYWLSFAKNKKKVFSYAPSIGITDIKELDDSKVKKLKENLTGFAGISCREQPGSDLINQIMGTDVCRTVLDPTMAVDRSEWDRILPEQKKILPSKYVFAYILRGDANQRKLVEEYARKKGLPIVTFPYLDTDHIVKYDKYFGDYKIYDSSPADFVKIISEAKYVFTDSFHCAVFSILYNREFCLFPKVGQTQNTRLYDLQSKFGIKDRLIIKNSLNEVERLDTINWEDVNRRLEFLRSESRMYIKHIL